MKTISFLAVLVAIAAFFASALFNFEIACSLSFAAGLLAIFGSDYNRRLRLIRLPASIALTSTALQRRAVASPFGLAA